MPRTLFGKLLIVVLLFCTLMTGICIVLMRTWHTSYHAEVDQIVNRDVAQRIVDANLFFDNGPVDVNNYHQAVAQLSRINPAVDAYLLDDTGQVMAASLPSSQIARQTVNVAPVQAFLRTDASLPIFGDDPSVTLGDEVFSAANIVVPGCPARYLYLVLNRSDSGSALAPFRQSQAINETIGVLAFSAILAVAATIVVMRILTRNLGRLESAMHTFRASGFTALSATSPSGKSGRGDEIDRLTTMFWELAEKLRAQVQDLQHTDDIRREILANVSHDLRSPLAALSAHLETLSLQPDLPAEEHEQYLKTSMSQCRSLSRLVDQLLEAARIDSGQVNIDVESFHIGELLHDIAQKFRLRAEKSEVELRVEDSAGLPFVQGDIGLIERALDNLLDNAFQYTSQGGCVSLSAEPIDGHVCISVKDDGSGISSEERDRVLERFYRADRSRAPGSGHAGLGLAIVNGIARLHGSQLEVESSPGIGTRISFKLPIS